MKNKSLTLYISLLVCIILVFTACDGQKQKQKLNSNAVNMITTTDKLQELDNGLSAVRFDGAYGFDSFLNMGGASSDADVVEFLKKQLGSDATGLSFHGNPFGCSTISVKNLNGGWLFGRNFDWNNCDALILQSKPDNGYASISTVNTNFINGIQLSELSDKVQAMIALYAPLDGMNEKGLAVSVNMISDGNTINQNTVKPDIITTTAVRLLLNKAATTDEAVALLQKYDMHASMNYMVHFAIADNSGNSIVIEYINNEMMVTKTPVVTNFYLSKGDKYGIGTDQSHKRYDILMDNLSKNKSMTVTNVRDALDSVSKDNFDKSESTEWSIVFNQTTGEVQYYHRENYTKCYSFHIW